MKTRSAESEPKMIAVTGGPCAGKTTVLKALQREFAADVVVVPEAATMLLPGFLAVREESDDAASAWQKSFQKSTTMLQLELEATYRNFAKKNGKRVGLCDRGINDADAYTAAARTLLEETFGLAADALDRRYDAVIYLESLATADPVAFSTSNNEQRYETLEQARALEYRTREAWLGTKALTFIGGCDIDEKIRQAGSIVRSHLQ